MKINKYQMDMCKGPLLKQMIRYSLPLVLSTFLQYSFNIADLVVVGRLGSSKALAGVGVTTAICNFVLGLLSGGAIGATVVVGRFFGAKNRKMVSRTVHTAITFGIMSGIVAALLGLTLSRPVLQLLDTPDTILQGACTYLRIYMCGSIFFILYNIGSGILRASGDSSRPLVFITIAGIINVLLNLFFVTVCKWYEGGVAAATIISKAVSAFLVMRLLYKSRDACRVKISNLRIDSGCLKDILWIGMPAGFQASVLNLSNMVMQSATNSFGMFAVAGAHAASNIGTFLHTFTSPISSAAVAFMSQNIGGKHYDRMYKTIYYSLTIALSSALIMGTLASCFRQELIAFYNPDPEVVRMGSLRASVTLSTFFLLCFMELSCGYLRGIGYSVFATVSSLIGGCVMRLLWVWFIFPLFPDSFVWLFVSYPVSWFLTGGTNMLVCRFLCKKKYPLPKKSAI